MNMHDRNAPVDAALFRRVMSRFATGVTVIAAEADGEVRGMTANAFLSGSLRPPLCVISVAVKAHMHDRLVAAGCFGVSFLASGQEAISAHFAGRSRDHLRAEFEFVGGAPLLRGASAVIAAETEASHACGDHTLFIGRIVHMRDHDRAPLVFHGGRYGGFTASQELAPAPTIEFW
jgi:flavin reductase (DIM6/NTAB) family NADH-FMN oxidoreductase RutF